MISRPAELQSEWNRKVIERIDALAAKNVNPNYLAYLRCLWLDYLDAGLAQEHFVCELTQGANDKFQQRVSEMMVGRHLASCGYNVTSPPENGQPDFRCERDGKVVWVETTCITAGKDPCLAADAQWRLQGYVPHDNILLRWTSGLNTKIKQGRSYRDASVIKPYEAYVIVINGGLVWPVGGGFGVSNLPSVMEITMAVGALQFSYDRETLQPRPPRHLVRVRVLNNNQAPIETTAFYRRYGSCQTHPLRGRLAVS